MLTFKGGGGGGGGDMKFSKIILTLQNLSLMYTIKCHVFF